MRGYFILKPKMACGTKDYLDFKRSGSPDNTRKTLSLRELKSDSFIKKIVFKTDFIYPKTETNYYKVKAISTNANWLLNIYLKKGELTKVAYVVSEETYFRYKNKMKETELLLKQEQNGST